MLSSAAIVQCQRQLTVADAVPSTPALRDYELIGPVNTALLDIPLGLDSDGQRMVGKSDGIELLEFNPHGYLTTRNLGQWRDGKPSVYPYAVYVLDEKDRVVQMDGDQIKSGGPAFRVSYKYSVDGNAIDIKADKVEIFGGRPGVYRTYRQEFGQGTTRLLIFVQTTARAAPVLERMQAYENGRLVSAINYSSGRPLDEERYDGAKPLVRKLVNPGQVRTGIGEETWTYGEGSRWPLTETVAYREGRSVRYKYEYVLDDHGNWTTKSKYLLEDSDRKLIRVEKRRITYY